ncbi:MAG: DUF456 domain-containing protein [Planctomycetota bacterium]
MTWLAAGILLVVGVLASALTLVSLPGTWLLLGTGLLCWWLVPGVSEGPGGWWWIAAAGVLVLVGEAIEFLASVAGAKVGGAGKHGAWGAFIGGLAGAILGTVFLAFIPVLGTIIGGVVGAGLFAALFERGGGKKSWGDSTRAGTGAAVGKLASMVLKSGVAAVIAVLLVSGAVWAGIDRIGGDDPGTASQAAGQPVPRVGMLPAAGEEPDGASESTPGPAEPKADGAPPD